LDIDADGNKGKSYLPEIPGKITMLPEEKRRTFTTGMNTNQSCSSI